MNGKADDMLRLPGRKNSRGVGKFNLLLLCAALAVSLPAPADAQGLKGLIKKKVTSEVSGDKGANKTAAKAGEWPAPVVEALGFNQSQAGAVTVEAIDRFGVGLDTEIRGLIDLLHQLRPYRTEADYQKCVQQVSSSPELQQVLTKMSMTGPSSTPEQVKALMANMQQATQELIKRRCGGDINVDWPVSKRQQRLIEIEKAGSDAFDAARAAPQEPPPGGPASYETAPGTPTLLADDTYQWLRDLIQSFCASMRRGLITIKYDPVTKLSTFEFGFSIPNPTYPQGEWTLGTLIGQDRAKHLYNQCAGLKDDEELRRALNSNLDPPTWDIIGQLEQDRRNRDQ